MSNLEEVDKSSRAESENESLAPILGRDNTKKEKLIDSNLLKGTERRLTMPGHEELSRENIRRLKDSYRHPFDKIPPQFFLLPKKPRIIKRREK